MNKKLNVLVLSATALLLAACGGQQQETSSSETMDNSSITSSSSSSEDTSRESTSTDSSESSLSTDTEESGSTSEEAEAHDINLHAASDSVGVTIACSDVYAYPGSIITLDVDVDQGYILEYIRLYAPTTAEGGQRINPDAEGNYSFVMPNQDVDVYFRGVIGYSVSFVSDHATACLADDCAEFDLFGEGYPVYVGKATVESGYYFTGVTVADEQGNVIETWDDAIDQYGFQMPAGNVIVTAHALPLDPEIVAISGTYSNGVAIDMNVLDSNDFGITIGQDRRVTFISDWTNSDWTGIFTYQDGILEADVTNLTQDGYYTGTVRHLKAVFVDGGKFLNVDFTSDTASYHYVFGKANQGLRAKKLYMSDFLGDGYALAHRIVAFGSNSGDFFTYVNPNRTKAYYMLSAHEFGSTTPVYAFASNKIYTLVDQQGNDVFSFSYDGSKVKAASSEAGTYTGEGADLKLDGFGHYVMGEASGTYTVEGNVVTLSTLGQLTIDKVNKTYATGASSSSPTESRYAFVGHSYKSSTSKPIVFYNEEWESSEYTIEVKFGDEEGVIEMMAIKAIPAMGAPVISDSIKNNLPYTYNETTNFIEVSGILSSKTVKLLFNPTANKITYQGDVWLASYVESARNASNVEMSLVA